MKKTGKIVLCLTTTSFLAAFILGTVFHLTEPSRRANIIARDMKTVRRLLDLGPKGKIAEVRRYHRTEPEPLMGYALEREFREYDLEGKLVSVAEGPPQTSLPVGRFFIGWNEKGERVGFVTEASRYGFKSRIRFFVALTNDFQIRGVEVAEQEEDPGLGAEITKPPFKNQFAGLLRAGLEKLSVSKEPLPETSRGVFMERDQKSFEAWWQQHGLMLKEKPERPIHAVTGATISSEALTKGVQEAVLHLEHRLRLLYPEEGRQ